MKKDSLGVWKRFVAVWKPSFLQKLSAEKNSVGKSWGFWFLYNGLITVILTIVGVAIAYPLVQNFPQNFLESFEPEATFTTQSGEEVNIRNLIKNSEITLKDGKFSTKNIPDPLFITGTGEDQEIVFILDTKERKFSVENLREFEEGVFISADQMVIKQENGQSRSINFADLENSEEIFLNYQTVEEFSTESGMTILMIVSAIAVICLFIFLAVIRLVSAVFWALIFWGIGAIFHRKNWDFPLAFSAMLHFSLVTLIFGIILKVGGFHFFGHNFLLLAILFGMNWWHLKTKK